jgi:hypothetical protein
LAPARRDGPERSDAARTVTRWIKAGLLSSRRLEHPRSRSWAPTASTLCGPSERDARPRKKGVKLLTGPR